MIQFFSTVITFYVELQFSPDAKPCKILIINILMNISLCEANQVKTDVFNTDFNNEQYT